MSEERDLARELIDRDLSKAPFIRGRITLDPISWDDPYASALMPAHLTPQDAINQGILPSPSACDVVIVILWGRFGTPLPKVHVNPDGTLFQSGTQWEYEDALNSAKANGKPTILLYRRTEEPKIGVRDPKALEKFEQYQKVEAFFSQLQDEDGALIGSYHPYTDPDHFRRLLRQHLESIVFVALGQGFSEEFGVTEAAVENFLRILKEQDVPPEQLEAKLEEIAERHLKLTEKLHALSRSNDEPEITNRREQAAEAIEQGDYDQADALLAEAVAIGRRAIEEQQDELDRRKLSVAATLSQQGELERTRLNYQKAARYFGEAASLVPSSEHDARLDYSLKQASTLVIQGSEFGENAAVVEAVDIYRLVLKERTRERAPLEWAKAQALLGSAFVTLGEREGGTDRLEEAVNAYRAALQERTRARAPLEWAAIQNGLAIALKMLGEREEGTDRLEQAIGAYNAVLEEFPRDRIPLNWSKTQMNLGNALRTLGERKSGKRHLEESVSVLKATLRETICDRGPFDMALIQLNLGLALKSLGERESGKERLEEAIMVFRLTLEEFTRERAPLLWATVQSNLGSTFRALGERECGTDRLEEAIAAYKAALKERTRERAPLQWAWTQDNLGLAYCLIAKKDRDENILLKGIEAIKASLEVFQEGRVIYNSERAKQHLADAKALLAEIGSVDASR